MFNKIQNVSTRRSVHPLSKAIFKRMKVIDKKYDDLY